MKERKPHAHTTVSALPANGPGFIFVDGADPLQELLSAEICDNNGTSLPAVLYSLLKDFYIPYATWSSQLHCEAARAFLLPIL